MLNMKKGFTLIELLIVVAIIAILAAIAVPNFLEAQVRSKVARARADLRSIATAIEAYRVSDNGYPNNPDPAQNFYVTPWQLTTPIAYISSRPLDPFTQGVNLAVLNNQSNLSPEAQLYTYWTVISIEKQGNNGAGIIESAICVDDPLGAGGNRSAFRKYGAWFQCSIGPDRLFDLRVGGGSVDGTTSSLSSPQFLDWGYSFDVPYDPTNGTISFGNVIRTQIRSDGTVTVHNP